MTTRYDCHYSSSTLHSENFVSQFGMVYPQQNPKLDATPRRTTGSGCLPLVGTEVLSVLAGIATVLLGVHTSCIMIAHVCLIGGEATIGVGSHWQ